jgi:hypothetical protein
MDLRFLILLGLILISNSIFAASTPPQGFVDKLDKDHIYGWAKDPDSPGTPVSVHVYCYPRGSTKPLWGISIKADNYRRDVGAHGFSLTDPRYARLHDGEYEIVAYAIGKNRAR